MKQRYIMEPDPDAADPNWKLVLWIIVCVLLVVVVLGHS